ncbi:GILT-like protein 1 isoform X3 [Artemia franciscana]|uniref:GILT-like protein 1 isoform X3 n=1 Tax=Artemia franciscana TaxID=6661 RepID=UPI0032DAC65A
MSALNSIVNLDVYYESLSHDSRNFIKLQLVPTWNDLVGFMNLTLIPFGKATFTPNGDSWDFTCQNGPDECDGNILHSCVLKYTEDSTIRLNYINCLMKNPGEGEACGASVGQSYAPSIKECYEGEEGKALLKAYGDETLSLDPALTSVPWLVFDGEWNEMSQWNGFFALKSEVCNHLTDPFWTRNRLLSPADNWLSCFISRQTERN